VQDEMDLIFKDKMKMSTLFYFSVLKIKEIKIILIIVGENSDPENYPIYSNPDQPNEKGIIY
jgi:hypothetical protein